MTPVFKRTSSTPLRYSCKNLCKLISLSQVKITQLSYSDNFDRDLL